MTTKDSLGDRMKRYESTTQTDLLRRTPVIIRIDGKAFHSFAKRVSRVDPTYGATPFSQMMRDCMVFTTEHLVRNIQGCVLGYTQSDEISLLLRDWDELETQAWFGNNLQKIVSVSASLASQAFNFYFQQKTGVFEIPNTATNLSIVGLKPRNVTTPVMLADYATFDSRAFNLPKEEVENYFIWRQQDASRNSVQMLGHHLFSQKVMHGKNNSQVQDMLMLEKGVNWNDMPTWAKRGTCVENAKHGEGVVINTEIPIFTQDRSYISKFMKTPTQAAQDAAALEAWKEIAG